MPRPRVRKKSATRRSGRLLGLAGKLLLLVLAAGAALLAFEWLRLPDPAVLAGRDPGATALMRERQRELGRPLRHSPVPLERISIHLRRAVVLAEDARFWRHDGIDWVETRQAATEALERRRLGRGASTLTQQLAKNLYLSEERSLTRKAREWVLAWRLERTLTKRRILELYLNHVEWGEGVFGAEAAARHHFGKPAAELEPAEAAVLAAMLPAPRRRNLATPDAALLRRARRVARLLVDAGFAPHEATEQRVEELLRAE